MTESLPDRLEAGTHNMPGITGLLEGVRYVQKRGEGAICRKERQLAQLAQEGLRAIPGVRVFGQPDLAAQAGVVSFTVDGRDVETVGTDLAEQGIAVRTGLHCAPTAHRSAGTLDSGTVRVRLSDFNTWEEVRAFLAAMKRILG